MPTKKSKDLIIKLQLYNLMKIDFDKDVDAAYIYLDDALENNVAKTININENITLDFDSEDKLVGIEVLNASKNLAKVPEGLVNL